MRGELSSAWRRLAQAAQQPAYLRPLAAGLLDARVINWRFSTTASASFVQSVGRGIRKGRGPFAGGKLCVGLGGMRTDDSLRAKSVEERNEQRIERDGTIAVEVVARTEGETAEPSRACLHYLVKSISCVASGLPGVRLKPSAR